MNQQKKDEIDILIIGAGIIGATQALLLAKRFPSIRIVVIDHAAPAKMPDKANVRVTALGQQARTILQECGVWQRLTVEHICEYRKMTVWDEQSQGELEFDAAELGVSSLGHIVDHFVLQSLLQEEMQSQNVITNYYQSKIEQIVLPEKVTNNVFADVTLTEGMRLQTKLLIAADGVNSQVREMIGIKVHQEAYKQSGIVAVIETEKHHQNTAWQRFLETGPLALLPLSNGDSSIVWTIDNTELNELQNMDEQQFCQRLQAATQNQLGSVCLKSQRHIFPLSSQRALEYCTSNAVLIGDAAHGIHPLAGQGANLGFGDISLLVNQLSGFPDTLSRLVLRRYERQRKANNYAVDIAMTAIQKGFADSTPEISLLRGFGMNVINNNKPIQRLLFDLANRSR